MNIHRLIMFASALVITSACVEMPETGIVPQVGKEVQFGLSLGDGVKTRTVYGEETETGFPVYWINGDQVLIASPQCLDGRNSARYEVSCSTSVQSTADALSKVDDAGIQWGDVGKDENVHFYSIYPAQGNKLVVNDGEIEASLKVASTQYAKISLSIDGSTIYAQPADMGNVIMYAASTERYGQTVGLTYRPFSTVIEFITQTPGFGAGNQPLTIQSLTLTAPANGPVIAGDFKFDFDGPSIEPDTNTGAKSITVHFVENNEYTLKVDKQQLIKIKMCVMPTDNIKSLDGWKVVLATSAGNFTKTLSSKDQNGETAALAPGKVHKIVLPTLKFSDKEWEYNSNNWITSIPDYKKVYLTELSIPGAWYAGTPTSQDYQSTDNIQTLWNNGVRAFAVETKTMSGDRSSQVNPNGVVVSGLGSNGDTHAGGKNSLNVDAQGNQVEGPRGEAYRKFRGYMDGDGTQISTIISNAASAVTENEFGVLILSYADGGSGGRRYVDYGAWLNMLYSEYNSLSNTTKNKIYGFRDGETISENTTVGDVMGKLIIKINVDANIAQSGSVNNYSYAYGNNLPALFSYNPFVQQMEAPDFSKPYYSKINWKQWSDKDRNYTATHSNSDGFTWCFSSANRTSKDNSSDTTIPEYKDRKAALGAMMAKSKQIYDASTHNVWFYFNCGGTQATSMSSDNPSPTGFATVMNSWLLETINAKLNTTDASPLGIVMFNQCTNSTYHGPEIIKAIIEMNSKFYLKHEGDYDFERPVSDFEDGSLGVDAWGTDFIQ